MYEKNRGGDNRVARPTFPTADTRCLNKDVHPKDYKLAYVGS